jgi:nitrogen regulatory protein PII
MNYHERNLVTIICESFLEEKILATAKNIGILGYTIMEARGAGSRGLRDGDFEYDKNIKIEMLCKAETADALCEEIQKKYFKDFAVVIYKSTVSVTRPEKFN